MCQNRMIDSRLPAKQFDKFETDDDSSELIEDKHHKLFECSGYTEARVLFQMRFSQQLMTVAKFSISPMIIAKLSISLGQE